MIKITIRLILFVFGMICLSSCVPDNACTDAVQLPIPSLNIKVVSANGRSKFGNSSDTTKYNSDSLVLFIADNYKIDFTKPFVTAGDSLIKTDKWTLMNYFNPKLNYLYIKYNKNKTDTLFVSYTAESKNCSGTSYANFTISQVSYRDTVIDPVKRIYTIIHK
jgi:hypothetical protein